MLKRFEFIEEYPHVLIEGAWSAGLIVLVNHVIKIRGNEKLAKNATTGQKSFLNECYSVINYNLMKTSVKWIFKCKKISSSVEKYQFG